MSYNHPDPRIIATARILENLAAIMPAVRQHTHTEIRLVDGYRTEHPGADQPAEGVHRAPVLTGKCQCNRPSHADPDELVTCNKPRPCPEHDAPIALTTVEAAAEARLRMTNWLADIEAQMVAIATIANSALHDARRMIATRVAVPDKPIECRDGQAGKDGAFEWGDPLCHDLAHKSGLCVKHYTRFYRWRQAQGVDTSGMHAQAVAS